MERKHDTGHDSMTEMGMVVTTSSTMRILKYRVEVVGGREKKMVLPCAHCCGPPCNQILFIGIWLGWMLERLIIK